MFRYRRIVPQWARDLRKQHGLGYPNQWLGDSPAPATRRDPEWQRMIDETVDRMLAVESKAREEGTHGAS